MLTLDSRLFPVLAATSHLPNSEARVSLDFYSPGGNDVIGGLEINGEVSTKGLFTLVWKEFDIQEVLNNDPNYIQSLKDGSIAVLKIIISGNGQHRELIQKYTLTLPPRIASA